ncbi:hypothetical protein DYB34_007991 [Aphanomyces astaci]|uniref:Autophagy-related protein 2 n=1 Tax=Aphanomyces astaci TaxID=112090 RepID=A0A3R6VX17_APHAT|nr:hypothetical protein DYB34_007991 [Aphanomyces astaci]
MSCTQSHLTRSHSLAAIFTRTLKAKSEFRLAALSDMFFSLTALTDPALKRLYKFVLKRVLGRFLQHDLDMSQLQVHLRQGTLHLVELELNAAAINELLATSGVPFQMKRGFVGSVKVTVSYSNLLNESCLVAIDDIDIVLEPVSSTPPPPASTPPTSTPPTSNPQPTAHHTSSTTGNYDYETDAVAQEGLDFVATWIERVTSKIKVTVANLCITFEDSATCPVALTLHVPWMQLVDETPQEAYPSASILKGLQWKGLRVEIVHLHRDSIEETAAPFSVVPILVCDTVQSSYVQVKLYPASLLEIDVFVPHMQVLVQPKQISHLTQLAALFTPTTSCDTSSPPFSSSAPLTMYQSICDPPEAATWLSPDDQDSPPPLQMDPTQSFPTLSLAEFQRIERLLQQYQDQKNAMSRPALRRQGSSDSVTGLSELEDEEEEEEMFHDVASTSFSSTVMQGAGYGQSSMYMSARQPADEPSDAATLLRRVKVTVLSVELTMVYEDLAEMNNREVGMLPTVSHMERLVWRVHDVLVQAIMHPPPHPTNVHMSLHRVTCEERLVPRLSARPDDEDDEMLVIPWLRFLGDEKDVVVHWHGDESSTSVVVHAQPVQIEWDMFMLNRVQAFLNAPSSPPAPTTTTTAPPPRPIMHVHVPFVHIHLRFPLIASDPIRFGPSSRRGLAEDTLQLHFEHVKLGSDVMTWDALHVELVYPPAFNPRSPEAPLVAPICSSNVHAQCSWSVHTPTAEQLQAAAGVRANMKETFGSDAEQGEVSIGGGVDAWRQTELLEAACVGASAAVVRVHIPDAAVVVDKPVYDRLMILTDALVTMSPVDIVPSGGRAKPLLPCAMSVEIVCDGFHVVLRHEALPEYRVELDHVRIFSVMSWLGTLTSRLHETTELADDMRDISLHLHFSHLTWRVDMASNWLGDCLNVLLTTYPPAIVPLDTPHGAADSFDVSQPPIPLAMPSTTVFTKLVVQCYECVLDYAPRGISSRALLVLGKLCLSSNLVTDAAVQGYKVSVAEVSLFVHPRRSSPSTYELEDRWLSKTAARSPLSMQETIENIGFLEVATLDFADVFVRVNEESDMGGQLHLELCLGTIKLKVCFDSFETVRLVGTTWWDEFAKHAAAPPHPAGVSPDDEDDVPVVPVDDRQPSTALNVLDQIDFAMFEPTTGPTVATMRDTEARLLQTQVLEAKKPPVHRRRQPSTPLVIDDFFRVDKATADASPWFISNTTTPPPPPPSSSTHSQTVPPLFSPASSASQPHAGSPADDDDDPSVLTEDEELSPRSHSVVSPPDSPTSNENSARWYSSDGGGNLSAPPDPPAIYLHHVEIPIAGAAAALSFGEKELAAAIQTMTNECPNMKTPVMVKSILLRDFNVEMRLFGGHDWQPSTTTTAAASDGPSSAAPTADDKTEKAQKLLDALLENYVDESEKLMQNKPKSRPTKHRKTEEMLELRLSNIKLRLDLYAEDSPQPLAQNTVLHVGDVEILDYISTSQIRKLLCYWKSDTFHPRETGTPLFHFHLMTVRTTEEEHRLKLKFLPLRINLDQDVLDFLKHFSSSADSPDDDEEKGARNVKPDLPAPLHAPTVVSDKPETAPGVASFFFQSVDIRSFKIKIDYRPQRVDFQALQAGDYLEVINLFVLEGMELSLRHIKLSGVSNWDALINQTLVHWVQDISRHQIHKCLASVVPMRSLSNIGAGAADLILLPMAQYGKDRRVELHVVAKTIVAVPLLEYQRTGSHGYVKSVIRAVPVAVLRPMIGATEAMSRALIGVRNAVDPEMKEDMENKFKDMS